MKQKSSNFRKSALKIDKNASNNAALSSKKGLIRFSLYQTYAFYMVPAAGIEPAWLLTDGF